MNSRLFALMGVALVSDNPDVVRKVRGAVPGLTLTGMDYGYYGASPSIILPTKRN